MTITAETLPRHELNGLTVEVVESDDPTHVGIAGRVVVETTNTLHVECQDGRVRQVPKADTVFEFSIRAADPSVAPDRELVVASPADTGGTSASDSESGASVEHVLVEGSRLVARPARRTERGGDSRWR